MKSGTARFTLILILVVAAGLRSYGLDWDEGQHAHPDERWIAMVAPTIAWPERLTDTLDPRRSTLNPLWVPEGGGGLPSGEVRNFAYGHLPLYLHSLVGHALAALGRQIGGWGPAYAETARELETYGEYARINVVGRMLSTLFDLGTIYLIYLLGKRIYEERVGLLGAALMAVAVMHVQLSHFSAFDVITTFFVTLSVYGSVYVLQAGKGPEGAGQARGDSIWPTIWAGAAAGLAVASKFSALPLVAVLVVAQIVHAARRADAGDRYTLGKLLRRSWPRILLSLLVALLAFFITSPFAILDFKFYLKQIIEQSQMVRGAADWPFTRQYRNTTPFLYQIEQQLRWGLGWPLGMAAFAGFGRTVARQFRHPRAEELVMLGWAVPYLILTGSFMVKFMRYMLPLLPIFILMGAAMLWKLGNWGIGRGNQRLRPEGAQAEPSTQAQSEGAQPEGLHVNQQRRSTVASAHLLRLLPYVVLFLSLLYALAFTRVYAQTHPWIQASRWIYAHVPDGATIAVEHWDDHLPMSLPEEGATQGAHGYRHVELPMYEPDSYDKYELIRSRLREADYVVLASNRLYRTIPRLPERYPLSAEFYRLLFGGELGYVREVEFTAYPGLFGLQIVDDDADESFTVYDHPKPIVFRKVRDLDDDEWIALFGAALTKTPVWELEAKKDVLSFLDRDPPTEEDAKRSLLLDRPVGELPVVADFGWNRWASESTVGAVLIWWLLVTALGWLTWPLTFTLFGGLRDRGYLLSRMVALLVIGYLVWLPTSLHWLKNGLPLTYVAIGVLTVASALLLWRNQARMAAFLRRRWGLVLFGEGLFGLAYLLFVGIRVLNPDLWQPWNGGEKLMDIAYLNSCLRSAYLPPYDPYYAHGYLNYYYYGQFLLSILVRLTGIKATVAFNLAVPLLFALTVCAAFSIGYTLAGRVWRRSERQRGSGQEGERTAFGIGHGLLAVLCVTILGNLASATQIIERLGWVGQSTFSSRIPGLAPLVRAASGMGEIVFRGARFPGFNYWDPSRVVAFTINEFPYWSFLFADLHPHMMNIPFTLLVVALALNWLRRRPSPDPASQAVGASSVPTTEVALALASAHYLWRRIDWGAVLNWVLWPIVLGALAPINTWDLPAYAGFSGLVLLFVQVRTRGRQGIVPALLASVALAGASVLLYAPFFRYYTPIYVGLGWSLGRTHTKLSEFLNMWGFTLFASATSLLILLARQRSRWAIMRLVRLVVRYPLRLHRVEELYALLVRQVKAGYRFAILGVILLVLVAIWWAWKGYWVLVLMVPLLALAAALMVQPEMPDERRFVLALTFTAYLILVGVEFLYLKDHLDGDQQGWWRMNTLFKFYLQVWMMLGIAVGVSLPGIWQAVERWRVGWRWAWTFAFTLLFVAAALYPVLGTPARVADRFPGARPPIGTLDGMAFMTVGSYAWPDETNRIELWGDYEAIRWLQENVPGGTPVLAEAPIGYYREFGVRASSYTGLPTLLGMHEAEQRYGWQVGPRSAQAHELYLTANLERTMELIRELGVEYVYLGPLERTEYPQAAAKFGQLAFHKLLSVVYRNDLVTIYEVR